MQEDSDGTTRPPRDACYFLDAEVLQIAQRNDLALGGRELLDGLAHHAALLLGDGDDHRGGLRINRLGHLVQDDEPLVAGAAPRRDRVVGDTIAVSYTHLRAHETDSYLVCRLLLEK